MRARAVLLSLVTVLGVGLAATGTGSRASASAGPALVGWTAEADANPFDFVVDSAAGLDGAHPIDEADLPEATSVYETGPFGYGLASVFWPGAVGGNFSSLLGEVGLPSQLAPAAGGLNDPVKAETFYPEGPQSADYPAGNAGGVPEMTSYAGADGSWAKAGLSDASAPGLFAIQSVHGSSTASATSQARSTATAAFGSLSLVGGLIQIGASVSTASASSDGVHPAGSTETHIGAIRVAGQPASLGRDGLVVGQSANALGPLVDPSVALADQVIALLDLRLTPLPATETRKGASEQITSGGFQVRFTLPSSVALRVDCSWLPSSLAQLGLLCHLPDVLQGATFTATVARATATATASAPFGSVAGPVGYAPPAGPSAGAAAGTSFTVPANQTATESAPAQSATAGVGTAPAPSAGTSPTMASPARSTPGLLSLVSLSSPVTAGLLGSLLVLAGLVSACLRRLVRVLDDPHPTACPLEDPQ